MKIRVNGEERETGEETTLTSLLDELQIEQRGTAVELNRRLVPKTAFSSTLLREGDVLEIIHFVGGG